jgi:hypothetical protein
MFWFHMLYTKLGITAHKMRIFINISLKEIVQDVELNSSWNSNYSTVRVLMIFIYSYNTISN